MRYSYGNPVGAMLAILIGLTAFGAWLYVCYPAMATELADESRQSWSFLLLLGFVVVALIGVTIAGSVLQGLIMLLRSVLMLALVAALVGGGIWLWRNQPGMVESQVEITRYQEPAQVTKQIERQPPQTPAKGRWWEQKR